MIAYEVGQHEYVRCEIQRRLLVNIVFFYKAIVLNRQDWREDQ